MSLLSFLMAAIAGGRPLESPNDLSGLWGLSHRYACRIWARQIGLGGKRVPPRPMAAGGRLTLNRLTLFAASRRRAAAPTPFPAFLSLHASCSSSGFPLCIAFESQKIGTISTSYFYLVGDPCSALPPPCRSVGPALSSHTHPRSRSVGRSSTGPHSTVT